MKLSVFFYFMGVATLLLVVAMQVFHPVACGFLLPLPFIISAIIGVLFCGVFVGRSVMPLQQLYQYKLFGQKDWGKISDSEYHIRIVNGETVKEIFVGTLYLSCWALLPLIFFYVSYVYAEKYVENMPLEDSI